MTAPSRKLQVLIVCIQPLLCEGIVNLLAGSAEIEMIGPVELDQALSLMEERAVDVVILAGERATPQQNVEFGELLDRIPRVPLIQAKLSERTLRLYLVQEVPASKDGLFQALHALSSRSSFLETTE